MAHISISRHQMIFDPIKNNPQINIIGAGATGSRLWLALVELGLTNITVYDFDVVEGHNIANQIYLSSDIGMPKVAALKKYYQLKTGKPTPDTMHFIAEKVSSETHDKTTLKGVVFLLTDTMKSRADIFDNLIVDSETFLMVETRMASSYGDVYVVNPFDERETKAWRDTLVNDEDAEVSPCGASISVGPTASIIANLAVWQTIHALTNKDALDKVTNIHLKPLVLSLGDYDVAA